MMREAIEGAGWERALHMRVGTRQQSTRRGRIGGSGAAAAAASPAPRLRTGERPGAKQLRGAAGEGGKRRAVVRSAPPEMGRGAALRAVEAVCS